MAKEPQKTEHVMTEADEGMIEVGLTDATHQQLLWFCKQQGYEYSDTETQNQTYSRIKAAWEHPTITVPIVIEEDRVNNKPFAAEDDSLDWGGLPPFVKIKILSLGDESKTEEHLALNGVAYRIQIGEVVTLPRAVFKGCILDAQQYRYRSDTELGLGEPVVTQAIAFTRIA